MNEMAILDGALSQLQVFDKFFYVAPSLYIFFLLEKKKKEKKEKLMTKVTRGL